MTADVSLEATEAPAERPGREVIPRIPFERPVRHLLHMGPRVTLACLDAYNPTALVDLAVCRWRPASGEREGRWYLQAVSLRRAECEAVGRWMQRELAAANAQAPRHATQISQDASAAVGTPAHGWSAASAASAARRRPPYQKPHVPGEEVHVAGRPPSTWIAATQAAQPEPPAEQTEVTP